jgi:uncharacterized protein (DUF1778 family)
MPGYSRVALSEHRNGPFHSIEITPSAKRVIQRAAAVSGLSAADLAYEGARRVLNEHEHMELTEADRKVFVRALLSPWPAPRNHPAGSSSL